MTGDSERARDAVQEAFATAVRKRRSFRSEGPLEAWVWRIVLTLHARTFVRSTPALDYDEPAASNGHPERDAELRVMLARLPERQRTAVFLRYYADLDYAAIGEALGISPGTVAATLNAAHHTPHPTGGPNVTEPDRASLERILDTPAGSPNWDDVLSRAGAGRGRRRRAIVVLAAAGLVVILGTASAFGTVRGLILGQAANSKIAFTSFRDGRWDAYVMNADGSGQRNLTRNLRRGFAPAWSPDGRKIVYSTGWPDNPDLYVMNADGRGLRRLTRGPAWDGWPAWSPDGRTIAFQRTTPPGEVSGPWQSDVYVVNVDGSGERNLTGDALSSGPLWSPDGQKLAFTSSRDGKPGIYVMNADGSGQRRLIRNSGGLQSWSPDGRKIAFVRAGGFQGIAAYIYVMNADGSRPRRLTRMVQVSNSFPLSWSPDGRKLVFVSERDGNFEVYVTNADGSGQRNLTRNPGHDSDPAWSPDGRKIAFVTKRDGNFEVYVMNVDGSGQRNLTRNPAPDRAPIWSPGVKKVS